ncbi:coiled-coil domain-containing protein 42-like isoform X1 [Cylas formicarius]|uniref:coiled-coil domain-containing protein 42-like isoform X1 n=1 Tax=Cylas formicarius TaxID=197179 RepID=UPI002958370D|nr:coiled-coil domain-containing protein 42-like isoform X1 [Cylas formicarius]
MDYIQSHRALPRKDSLITVFQTSGKVATRYQAPQEYAPEKNVLENIASKQICKQAEMCLSGSVRYAEANAKRNRTNLNMHLTKTEQRLKQTRKVRDRAVKVLKEQWRDLAVKENELRENFVAFSEFVRDNSEKRARAKRKMEEDQKLADERQNEINKLERECVVMEATRRRMDKQMKSYKIYPDYLLKVVENCDEFVNIDGILSRYRALSEARALLDTIERTRFDVLKNCKMNMMKMIEEKSFVIMGLNNEIASLQARFENANIEALNSESLVTEIKNNAVKHMRDIDMVKNSIWNIYTHMALSKKHAVQIKKDNVEDQMMYINRTLAEIARVNKIIKRRSAKAAPKKN